MLSKSCLPNNTLEIDPAFPHDRATSLPLRVATPSLTVLLEPAIRKKLAGKMIDPLSRFAGL
jgi:hypothetical protein